MALASASFSIAREPETRKPASEVKFLIGVERAQAISDWARGHIGPDPHATDEAGCYQTSSLYFDTGELDVLNQRGSYARSKYRVRRYGNGEGAFLERKMKKAGVVTKRRSVIGIHDLSRLAQGKAESGWSGYWFHRRILARQLKPVIQISYRRLARMEDTPAGPIRLTMDRELLAHRTEALHFDSGAAEVLLLKEELILELKFQDTMPALFSDMVDKFGLAPATVSKYRLAAGALGISESPVAEPCCTG